LPLSKRKLGRAFEGKTTVTPTKGGVSRGGIKTIGKKPLTAEKKRVGKRKQRNPKQHASEPRRRNCKRVLAVIQRWARAELGYTKDGPPSRMGGDFASKSAWQFILGQLGKAVQSGQG